MLARTHIALGVASALGISSCFGVQLEPPHVIPLVLGSLIPDIDERSAVIARPGTLFGAFLPRWLRRLLDGIGKTIASFFSVLFGHRRATHWLIIGAAVSAAGLNFRLPALFWFGWGWSWHILGDALTAGGVPVFGPVYRKPLRFSSMRTGGVQENILAIFLWGFIAFWGWGHIPGDWRGFFR